MFTYMPLCFHLESCVLPRSKIAELYGKHKVWFKLRFKGNSLSFKRLSGRFPQEKSPITHHQCVSLTNTSYGLFLMVVNYWSNISHLVIIWILLMTNEWCWASVHAFPGYWRSLFVEMCILTILCSVSSHKTFDYEVNSNSFYPFVFFGDSSICNSFTCISGPVGLGDWCFKGQWFSPLL